MSEIFEIIKDDDNEPVKIKTEKGSAVKRIFIQ